MVESSDQNNNTHTYVVLTKGTMVSHYRIVEKIGAGGMGEVWLAEDIELKRRLALKFLPAHLCQDEDCRARFKREAQAAAKLKYPNIVTIYEVSEFHGRPFFAMELVEGQSLRDAIKQKLLSLDQIIDLTFKICEGLREAHEAGIVHRDIKPSNIILDKKGRPKLVDFGLATVHGTDRLTKNGSTVGTIGYMSPEQIKGNKVDHRSDLFSLGVVFYELLTDRQPFDAEHEAAIQYKIVHEAPPRLSSKIEEMTEGIQRIIDKLLEKDPALRYQNAAEILIDLKREKRDQSDPSRPSSVLRPTGSKTNRNMSVILVFILAVIIVGIGIIYFSKRSQPITIAQQRQVTFCGDVKASDISPDGTQFIFVRESDKQYTLFLQDFTGKEAIELLSMLRIISVRFSPDGSRIAVVGVKDSTLEEYGLFLTSRLGGSLRFLNEGLCGDYSLAWSPDSKKIAVQESCSSTKDSIIIIDIYSGEKRYIPVDIIFDWLYSLDWSPDGSRFIAATESKDNNGTWIIDTGGTAIHRLMDKGLSDTRWARNSDHLYYLDYQSGTNNLMKVGINPISADIRSSPSILFSGLDALDFSISKDFRKLLYIK